MSKGWQNQNLQMMHSRSSTGNCWETLLGSRWLNWLSWRCTPLIWGGSTLKMYGSWSKCWPPGLISRTWFTSNLISSSIWLRRRFRSSKDSSIFTWAKSNHLIYSKTSWDSLTKSLEFLSLKKWMNKGLLWEFSQRKKMKVTSMRTWSIPGSWKISTKSQFKSTKLIFL